jgi:MarR family transcriptional regulator, transcriptional regulator for hemolysin
MSDVELLRRDFTSALVLAARQWRKTVGEAMDGLGVSEACVAPMLWAGRLGGGVRQVALADYVGIEGPSLVRLIDQLENSGLVVRRDDPTDRRAKTIWLTPEGEVVAREIEARLVRLRENALSDVPPEKLTEMLKLLGRFGAPSVTL